MHEAKIGGEKVKRKNILMLSVALLVAVLCGCSPTAQPEPQKETAAPTSTNSRVAPTVPPESTSQPPLVPEHEVELVARTLRGECYDEQHDDKCEVVKVICNRVSDSRFGDSIEAVITAPKQFIGYRPGNVPTANDYEIAREVLTEWYSGGCAPLGEYLFFASGSNHKNVFRKEWKEK